MSTKTYFVISTDGDGEARLEAMSREELVSRLNDEYYDTNRLHDRLPKGKSVDLQERSGIYIIEGEIVTPQVTEKAIEWTV